MAWRLQGEQIALNNPPRDDPGQERDRSDAAAKRLWVARLPNLGPGWITTTGFDIEAKADAGAGEPAREQVLRTIQALLADLKMRQLITQRMSMATLANILTFDLRRPVMDETGLNGDFAFTLEWTLGLGESDAGPSSQPSLFTAVQEQLGLKLESAKGPVEVMVIDHAETPSDN